MKIRFMHYKSEIWLYNLNNFKTQASTFSKLLSYVEAKLRPQEGSSTHRVSTGFYVEVFQALGGPELLMEMIKEFKPFILQVRTDQEYDKESVKQITEMYKLFYKVLTNYLHNNADQKLVFMQNINLFTPLDEKEDFGELKLVILIMTLNTSFLNYHQLQILQNYVRDVVIRLGS